MNVTAKSLPPPACYPMTTRPSLLSGGTDRRIAASGPPVRDGIRPERGAVACR
jgi:hypothetical protein